ncbi:HTH-type transcriptional repressor Bm3R1 [Pseudoclavibacter triregionum]|nr:HTH-type transcriptional repressor Bm3R1 [Pseudoclavibacter triregionum]
MQSETSARGAAGDRRSAPAAPATSAIPVIGLDPADDLTRLSQRERNRRDTWLAIHRAAFELADERGYAATTMDAIAERAGVSRRTLFNYFATKEDAVLGLVPPHCPEDVLARLATQGDDPFRGTVRLLVTIIRSTFPRATPFAERQRLARTTPELQQRFQHQVAAAETLAGELLSERLDAIEARAELPAGVTREDAARALIIFAGGVMKYVARTRPDSLFEDGDAAIDEAIDVFRAILKETL